MKVLFVCHGNVNRSAAAEIISKQDFPEIEVKSCGLKTSNGKITSKKMREVLNNQGYKTVGIRSQIICKDLVDWADYILYMDDANKRRFEEQFPECKKAQKLSNFISGVNKIPDPAFGGIEEFINVVKLLKFGIEKFYGLQKI